ncbi:MAG: AbrB/MazE/SpoVT family DNA-binding domain-containing protein [Syntrophothermus sp.]
MGNYHIKLTSKGQITLPKDIRDKMKISTGDYLQAHLEGEKLVMKPIREKTGHELIMEYAQKYGKDRITVEEGRKILGKIPFSMSERVRQTRDEEGLND